MPSIGFSVDVVRVAALLCGLGMLAIAIEIVWRRPGRTTSSVRQLLLSFYLIALWLTWVAGLLGVLWLGLYALLLPAAVRGVGNVAQAFASGAQRSGALGTMLNVLIVRGARAAVIGAAVAWLAYLWRIRAAALAGGQTGGLVVSGLLNSIIILLVADLLWQMAKALIAYRMELAPKDGSNADDLARNGRLRTLLPIFRNVLAVFIAAVSMLTILSGLGVQIAPLIAGAGIFGVAIGFGSQTLVKDILSGVFYMLDDAFRVGEYIQSGSYKGTVESFSLRSVRLRHHRGPIFTVPFGELGAIQNMSRDWVMDKIALSVTYDSDVDLARRLIKKIGQELAADPEFAADTIEPLKMQGVDNFGDSGIDLRMKLMTKPGTQFGIKRRAFMMIKKAFDENGIKLAVPTVHVEGGGDNAAAAQQQLLKMKQAAG
jgi:small-conductance mechanosensitive channel